MTNSNSHAFMSADEFIDMAIAYEAESAAFYHGMQQKAQGSTLQLLQLLETQELSHKRLLERFDRGDLRAVIQFPPDLAAGTPSEVPGDLDLAALIELAIAREQFAARAYQAAAAAVTGPFRELIEGLSRFEREHEERLRGLRNL